MLRHICLLKSVSPTFRLSTGPEAISRGSHVRQQSGRGVEIVDHALSGVRSTSRISSPSNQLVREAHYQLPIFREVT